MQRLLTLPATEPRCDGRARYCDRASACARALVAADKGRPLMDYTSQTLGWTAKDCPGYRNPAECREQRPARAGRVFDAPEGGLA